MCTVSCRPTFALLLAAITACGCGDATQDPSLQAGTAEATEQPPEVEDLPITPENELPTVSSRAPSDKDQPMEEDLLAWNPFQRRGPAWQPTSDDGTSRHSVEFVDSPLLIFCEFMGGLIERPIWIRGGIPTDQTLITLTVKDKPIEELFEMALSPHGLRMQKHGDGWRVVGIEEPADSGEHPIIFSGPRRTRTLVGESMPAITGASVGTAELPTMTELSGKVVLVNFWATWCPPCVEAIPDVNRLQQKYRDRGLIVVGVHAQRRSDKLVGFLEANPVEFPVVRDDGETADRFALFAVPMYVLVGRSGTVVNEHQGTLPDDAEIEAELDRTDTSSDSSGR